MNNKYKKTIILGKGEYCSVYKAKDESGNEIYAMKEFNTKNEKELKYEGIPPTALREVYILKELNHINIERLIDVLHIPKYFTLVFEFIDKDLKKIIDEKKFKKEKFSPVEVKSYLYQLLKGTAYMYKHKIIHRDLKPGHLLITKDNILKIADFGHARCYSLPTRNFNHNVVSNYYRAPDIFLGNTDYITDIDMWSIGCIFAEMILMKPPFRTMESLMVHYIFHFLGTPTEETYPKLEFLPLWDSEVYGFRVGLGLRDKMKDLDDVGFDLLMKFLQVDPSKRISAEEALNHPYFNDLDETTKELYINDEKGK